MFIKECCIIKIYTKSTEGFSVGRVFCQNEDCVVIEDIDVQGKITGYRVMKKSIISQLQYLHFHTAKTAEVPTRTNAKGNTHRKAISSLSILPSFHCTALKAV